jgi:nitroreductase
MDMLEAIVSRRSIRAFKPDPVPELLLDQIWEAARWAPSAGNLQAREFVLVTDLSVKRTLCDAALNQRFIEEAPVDIVVCVHAERSAQRYGERGRNLYCLQDATAAIQNILLAAHALGLGACWVGAFNEKLVSHALTLPRDIRPIALIPIGYPAEQPLAPSRLNLEDLVYLNRYEVTRALGRCTKNRI